MIHLKTVPKSSLRYRVMLWVPFVYSLFICWGVLRDPFHALGAMPAGFIPFVSFLPMAFLFVATFTDAYIQRLEARLNALEEKMKTPAWEDVPAN